jgi:hypothetical protein
MNIYGCVIAKKSMDSSVTSWWSVYYFALMKIGSAYSCSENIHCVSTSGGSWKVIFGKGTKLVVETSKYQVNR